VPKHPMGGPAIPQATLRSDRSLSGVRVDDGQDSNNRSNHQSGRPATNPGLLCLNQITDHRPGGCAGGLIVITEPLTSPPTATPPGAVTV
jgi:hypothetical protein